MSITILENYSRLEILPSARSIVAKKQCVSFPLFLRLLELDYNMSDLQYEHLLKMADPREREIIIIRSRGGSKTFDAMIVCLYYGYIGFHVIFWSPSQSQMEQPKEYLDRLTCDNFLTECIIDKVKLSVRFDTNGWIKIKNLTQKQARSPRCDLEVFDEESQADEDAYNSSSPVLSVSKLKKILHLSTPVKGSLFEQNYDRLKEEHKPCLIMRWDECDHMNQDDEFMKKELKTKPRWWVRQEYFCSFESPQGKVFENILHGEFDLSNLTTNYSQTHIHYGVDWNPSSGHYLVGTRWNDDYSKIYIIMEKNLGTDIKIAFETIFDLLQRDDQSMCEIEDGGTNMGYCDSLFTLAYKMLNDRNNNDRTKQIINRISRRSWDSAGRNKHQSINNLMSSIIYVNDKITPQTSYYLSSASWDENSQIEPKLLKTDDQHPLDAFLHASWIADRGVNHYQ